MTSKALSHLLVHLRSVNQSDYNFALFNMRFDLICLCTKH